MAALFSLVSFVIIGFLYVWFLKLGAKWTLRLKVATKLCWVFYGVVIAITLVNVGVSSAIGRPGFLLVGAVAHLLFGGWFFGRFAVSRETGAPGFVGGLKMTAVAMALLLAASGALIVIPTAVLKAGA